MQAVLFDLGGTLVEYSLPAWPTLLAQSIDALYAFLVRPEADLLPPAAEIPAPDRAAALRSTAGPDTALPHRITVALRRMVRAASGRTLPRMAEACARPAMAGGRLYDDTLGALGALRDRGYRLGLVSNTPWGTPDYLWENQVRRFGLADLLEVRLFSSGIGFRKPDVRIFREALARLGFSPARALFVGDNPVTDVAGARAAGMHTAWIVRGDPAPKVRGEPPDLRIRSLADLLDHLPDTQDG
jgi:putative hydrolase of the HAD superfamily